ncbi:MAG TPA: hypothetical protein VLT88_16320, partial [Desulfosarcina sp.]|nr:hypothetical protein [Desulfosarcina sp.]
MLKQVSLLKKFILGFALMLILLIVLAMVGYRGLSGVVAHNRVSDAVNAVGASLARARVHEQAFVVSRDKAEMNLVHEALEAMRRQIASAGDGSADDDIHRQLEAIRSRMADYRQAFDGFVVLLGEQSAKAARMDENSRFALNLTSRIRDREQARLEEIRITAQTVAAGKTALIDAAAQVYNLALESKVSRVALMASNDLSTMAQWKATNKKLEGEVLQLRPRLQTPANEELADRILDLQKAYIDDVLNYLRSLQHDDLDRMIKSVKNYFWAITS